MTKLSVNINKIATLRNSRGTNLPDLVKVALDCERFGAQGITVHPRPDERHIKYQDVFDLKPVLTTEFNIEGNPKEDKFVELVLKAKPEQVTLVPDVQGQLTSDHGWDTKKEHDFLVSILKVFKNQGIRTSIFVDPLLNEVEGAKKVGADRIELYTEVYSREYKKNRDLVIKPFVEAANLAQSIGLGVNAGHDLNLENLKFFKENIPHCQEVSIGHAIICDSLYYGLENTIQMYRRLLV